MPKDTGLTVYVDGTNIESAIKRFRKRVEKFKIIDEFKERRFYDKPSAIKNKKNRYKKCLNKRSV